VVLKHEADRSIAKGREPVRCQLERVLAVKRDRPGRGRLESPSTYSSELLPLPDGPMIAAASPGSSENDTSDRTASAPAGPDTLC
jgi:hypothetical protein